MEHNTTTHVGRNVNKLGARDEEFGVWTDRKMVNSCEDIIIMKQGTEK